MTLPHGTDRLESDRLALRRITSDDLPFFACIHALPEVTQYLYPGGRPRSPEEPVASVQAVLGFGAEACSSGGHQRACTVRSTHAPELPCKEAVNYDLQTMARPSSRRGTQDVEFASTSSLLWILLWIP